MTDRREAPTLDMASTSPSVALSHRLIDCYFAGGGRQLVKHQVDSFNDFITRKLEHIVEAFNSIDIR
jgi:DNA-directed RNA polymerase beta subunit